MHVTPSTAVRSTPLLLAAPGQVRSDIDDVAAATSPRAFVVGAAGSGKSSLLRHLQERLAARGVTYRPFDERTDPASVPPEDVLIVDGLHQLGDASAAAVRARAEDPGAALVVATRPWPRSPETAAIASRLTTDATPIVLGPVSRAEVVTLLEAEHRALSSTCVDEILTRTGGLGWLVARAIESHDHGTCADSEGHFELWRSVERHVSYRMDLLTSEPLRRFLELLSLTTEGQLGTYAEEGIPDLVLQGYAEGLLLRNATMVPVVRSAIRATMPPHRITELGPEAIDGVAAALAAGDSSLRDWVTAAVDPRLSAAISSRADGLLQTDPHQAGELYELASECGASASEGGLRRALAAWGTGDLDGAAAFADSAWTQSDPVQSAAVADLTAAGWAARGMMATGSDIYSMAPPVDSAAAAKSTIAHIAVGALDRLREAPPAPHEAGAMSTRRIALRELEAGLRASVDVAPPRTALTHLVRASELYTSCRSTDPLPELPAVIAACLAIGSGDLATAQGVLDLAVTGAQSGAWAERRLLLWQAWVALQGERPADARQALRSADEVELPCSPRDEFLRQAVVVSLARRYEDITSLEAAWEVARQAVRRIDVDLFTILPLSSLICAGARVGDADTLQPHFASALDILMRLGNPHLWSTHLRWAGVQQGIVLNKPDLLAPHARALVAATARSPLAQAMAQAGGVWVAVLGGTVDADAVDAAARALAASGLAWDGARLAAHGARRTEDRKASSRLLACARELHPPDAMPRTDAPSTPPSSVTQPAHVGTPLSEREAEVARLVLEGRTYAEIGEVMFISPRTVEHHVAHIKRRLSVTSRSDLMAKLRVSVELTSTSPPTDKSALRRLIS